MSLMKLDALQWLLAVHCALALREDDRKKLFKVVQTWKNFQIFTNTKNSSNNSNSSTNNNNSDSGDAIINSILTSLQEAEAKLEQERGGLSAAIDRDTTSTSASTSTSPAIRKLMQRILDDMHTDIDELDRVSLERLEVINPTLVATIKQAALAMAGGANAAITADMNAMIMHGNQLPQSSTTSTIIIETRSFDEIENAMEWATITNNNTRSSRSTTATAASANNNNNPVVIIESARDVVSQLQHLVRKGTTFIDIMSPTANVGLLIAASAAATHLTNMMQHLQDQQQQQQQQGDYGNVSALLSSSSQASTSLSMSPFMYPSSSRLGLVRMQSDTQRHVKKELFTLEGGLRQKDDWVIGKLYQQGLPFVSSSNGRRFATQIELSHHLDDLFRRT